MGEIASDYRASPILDELLYDYFGKSAMVCEFLKILKILVDHVVLLYQYRELPFIVLTTWWELTLKVKLKQYSLLVQFLWNIFM